MVSTKFTKNIKPLHINGMDGRLLHIANPKKQRQILLLYGHHASLERMAGIAEVLSKYGNVTMPDLPGFGGMSSFYKIGQKPTLDNYADYLASIIKLRYKRQRFVILAMSFSVPLVVKTLQKYPELAKRVDFVVSIAGFVHRDDFVFSKKLYWTLRTIAKLFSYRPTAWLASKILLTGPVIRASYLLAGDGHAKMKDALDIAERDRRIEFETGLWKMNDVRTRTSTMLTMFTLNVCDKKIDVPAYHITATEDRYFDNGIVEQHMHIIFKKLTVIPSEMGAHAPTTVATAKEAEPYIPAKLRKLL